MPLRENFIERVFACHRWTEMRLIGDHRDGIAARLARTPKDSLSTINVVLT
jgi:hypothetical protein